MKQYFISTFGCQMNVYDSGRLAGLLAAKGWSPAGGNDKADFIFLNTCSIREKAAQKVISRLKGLKPLKKRNPDLIIGVGGCLAEQEGREFLGKVPFLSLITGPGRLAEIPEILETLDPRGPAVILTGQTPDSESAPEPCPAGGSAASALSSFITVMEGCDNFCAYCVVPYLRGREKSRPLKDILSEAESLISGGCREITLLGQNVNSYAPDGLDSKKGPAFVRLLKELDSYKELWRLRFTTSHPKDFPPELIGLFGDLRTLAPHLHLPLQSGSDRILKAMGRRYDRAGYLKTVTALRRAEPDLALSTDIIVGFPGEDERDLEMTLEMLAQVRFDSIYSFMYSDRPQTKAALMPGKVAETEKARRLGQVQNLQKAVTLEINESYAGRTVEVLVAGPGREKGQMSGRTGSLKTVNFPGSPDLCGRLVPVRIESGWTASLLGQLVS
ncbi:MAG: tRNA (N6-isopentenyl adenosine(37)-C2)-methylthiotransferase MiaB [Deltaproteobacteria bacterium]|jgi:tRNA-2-methylthio-N6-dimethylallyladenosine synthase|nr:tRNA (N6-isopentenyl adenosine(37)-C2)-methylthiotransferase MiaB [Deltaproteobacteria bacterium]